MLTREMLIKLKECKMDEDFEKLGYKNTVGQLISLINCESKEDSENLVRLWVYSNEDTNSRIIISDNGNSYGNFLCEYYEGITVGIVKSNIAAYEFKGINGKLGSCKECGSDITEKM